MLIPLKPEDVPAYDVVIDIEVRRVLPTPNRELDPMAGPMVSSRVTVELGKLAVDDLDREGWIDVLIGAVRSVATKAIEGPGAS